ncbi:MAG: ABC transporter permease [Bacilli bacterium]
MNPTLSSVAQTVPDGRARMFHKLQGEWVGVFSGAMILLTVLVAVMAPFLSPYSPDAVHLASAYLAPSPLHWFGTDDLGRDVFTRVLFATRTSLTIGVVSVLIGGSIGTVLGLLSGYYMWLDGIVMRLMDILLAFPGIILALVVVAVLGASELNVIIATAIFSVPGFARLVRSSTLVAKQAVHIDAARTIGASNSRIMLTGILPNIMGPIIVQTTLRVGVSILISAGLSFLGLGVQPPTPDWGAMVSEGQVSIWTAPWISIFPGLAILYTVVSITLFGDWLRRRIDRKSVAGVKGS